MNVTDFGDTIAAIATPPGRGAIGVLRLSGPQALSIAANIAGELPPPRTAALRTFRGSDGAPVDRGLVLAFPKPNSFTGEDVVELQGHGGPAVLDLLLQAACAHGARIARPGEFSERAFLNDRMDLAQAEAIADLIDASTAQAARAAQRSLDGELSRRVSALVGQLIELRVFVEGALDFSDEDVDWLADRRLTDGLATLDHDLRQLLAEAGRGRRLREGLTIALAGAPNVGKSTLLNRLAGTEAAIVTDIPGTTRDPLRENLAIGGMPVTAVDTAGLRDSDDPVERIGIERAWKAMDEAALVLYLCDDASGLDGNDMDSLKRLGDAREVIVVRNKCDASGRPPLREQADGSVELRLSALTGEGMELLEREVLRVAGLEGAGEGLFSARARHVDALRRALDRVAAARRRIDEGATVELAAEELRLAQQAVSEITGAFTPDDLLGAIFSRFCIGK